MTPVKVRQTFFGGNVGFMVNFKQNLTLLWYVGLEGPYATLLRVFPMVGFFLNGQLFKLVFCLQSDLRPTLAIDFVGFTVPLFISVFLCLLAYA